MITPIEKSIKYFEKAKETAPSIRDLVYLDGVLAILDTVKVYEVNFLKHLKHMETTTEQKIIELFDKVLESYKSTSKTCIMEYPCSDEKKALEDLDKEIEGFKIELRNIINPDGKLYNGDFKKYYDKKQKRNIWVLGYFGGGSINVMDAYRVAGDYSNSTQTPLGFVKFDEVLESRRFKGFKYIYADFEQEPEPDAEIMDDVDKFLRD